MWPVFMSTAIVGADGVFNAGMPETFSKPLMSATGIGLVGSQSAPPLLEYLNSTSLEGWPCEPRAQQAKALLESGGPHCRSRPRCSLFAMEPATVTSVGQVAPLSNEMDARMPLVPDTPPSCHPERMRPVNWPEVLLLTATQGKSVPMAVSVLPPWISTWIQVLPAPVASLRWPPSGS